MNFIAFVFTVSIGSQLLQPSSPPENTNDINMTTVLVGTLVCVLVICGIVIGILTTMMLKRLRRRASELISLIQVHFTRMLGDIPVSRVVMERRVYYITVTGVLNDRLSPRLSNYWYALYYHLHYSIICITEVDAPRHRAWSLSLVTTVG